MARILTEGFEMGDAAIGVLSTSTITVTTADKRSGNYSLRCASGGYFITPLPDLSEMYIRVAIKIDVGWSGNYALVLALEGNTRHVWITRNVTTGVLEVRRGAGNGTLLGSGTTQMQINTWYLVEARFVVHGTTGVAVVKIDGVTDITLHNVNTQNTGTGACNGLLLGDSVINTAAFFDDLAVNDTSGSVDNSWCGDGRVIALMANANGDSSQWVGSDGNSVDNYLLVDERPKDDDTTYVETSTVDHVDLYNCVASGLEGVSVRRVWPEARARASLGDGTGKVRLGVKSGATEAWDAADNPLLTTYNKRIVGDSLFVDPNTSAAWTIAAIDALQVGIKAK